MAATPQAKKSSPASMPVDDYDRLSIKEILPLLKTLNGRELKAVAAYEKAGKNRVTLLRGVRKIELAREAAGPQRPAKARLTVVEEVAEPVIDDTESVADYIETVEYDTETVDTGSVDDDTDSVEEDIVAIDDDPGSFVDDFDDIGWPAESPAEAKAADAKEARATAPKAPKAPKALKAPKAPRTRAAKGARSAPSKPVAVDLPEIVEVPDIFAAPEMGDMPDVAAMVAEVIDPVRGKAPAAKKSRPRPVAKAATWEEEVRPQLPRRFESSTYDEIDPPIVALPSPSPALIPVPAATAGSSKTPKAPKAPRAVGTTSDKPLIVRRFESVALVMAAILAILLGLAIGTVLARSGSSDASPTPTSISSQAAAVQTAG